jgi:hypothetical protein
MRKMIAALAVTAAALGIGAATMTASTPDSPATTRTAGVGSWQVQILPYVEQDDALRSD